MLSGRTSEGVRSVEPRIGVALSGGGHRATAWGFGTLLALVDAGANSDVVSISSVSGGSIANGVVAQRIDYADADRTSFDEAIRPALGHIASEGLIFFGPSTNGYLARFFVSAGVAIGAVIALLAAALTLGRQVNPWWWLLAGPALTALAWAAWLRKADLPAKWRTLLFALGLLLPSVLAVGAVLLARDATGWQAVWRILLVLAVTVVAFAVALRTFGRRSEIVDDALAAVHFPGTGGTPTVLADLAHLKVHHVFCATELQTGDHLYFTPRLVYSYRVGTGTPGGLRLSTAVQASACLPGAMVPREIETDQFDLSRPWPLPDDRPPGPPERIVVNDGGVYDNMADQWEQGFGDRAERLGQGDPVQEPATHLVVANAGKALGWQRMGPTGPLAREVRALGRTVDILYDVTTSHRRQGLIRRFRATEAVGSGLEGALVHIAQSPYDVPRAFTRSSDAERARRAHEALDFLPTLGIGGEEWERLADRNARVPTVLRALGPAAVDLLEHAYLLATVNLYVLFGWGSLDGDPSRFGRPRFEVLCGLSGAGASEGTLMPS